MCNGWRSSAERPRSVADLDLELRGGGGGGSFTWPGGFSPFCHFFFNLPKIWGTGAPGPAPRSPLTFSRRHVTLKRATGHLNSRKRLKGH